MYYIWAAVNRGTYVMWQQQEKYSTSLKKGRTDFSIGDLDYFHIEISPRV